MSTKGITTVRPAMLLQSGNVLARTMLISVRLSFHQNVVDICARRYTGYFDRDCSNWGKWLSLGMKAAYLASLYSILAGFRQDRQACTFTSGQQ